MTESATSVAPEIVRYRLDASRSTFTAQAFAGGLLSRFGHNPVIGIKTFDGEVQFAAGTLAGASLRITVDANSLAVVGEVSEKDTPEIERTMLNDVLETSRHSEIKFESTSITVTRIVEGRYKARIIGDLTLHGVTQKSIWISAQVTLDGAELKAQGDFTVKHTDYHLKQVTVAAGALKVQDEMKLTFEMVGVAQVV
jgi:polyisoprenoid-binding protein YceI